MGKALVVDDDAATLEMILAALADERIEAVGIGEPLRVFDAAKREHPDVILLDLVMPALTGWDELRLLRLDAETRHIPVILMTAQPDEFFALAAAPPRDYFDRLVKPFSIDELAAKVRAALAA